MDKYIPRVFDNGKHYQSYVEMLLRTEKCFSCGKFMIEKDKEDIFFPSFIYLDQDAQVIYGGLAYKSNLSVDNHPICIGCQTDNKADFLCCLCGKRKLSNKLNKEIGNPAEFLCSDCYETVSVEKWDKKVSELEDEHCYDFE